MGPTMPMTYSQRLHSHVFSSEFRILAERFVRVAADNGVAVVPYRSPDLPTFSALPETRQAEIIQQFKTYVEVAESVSSEKRGIVESPFFLMRMIRRLGYTPCMDIFEKLTADSIVEIYTVNNVQIFRNFRFFEICSYTIEDLLAREWWQLYERDDEINREIFLWASRVLSGEVKATCSPTVARHSLIEKDSRLKLGLKVDLDYLSPLFVGGKVVAAIAVERAKIFQSSKMNH